MVMGARRDLLEAGVIGHADVGVAIGEHKEGESTVSGYPAGLLNPSQVTAGEVGHPSGPDRSDRLARRLLVRERAGGDRQRANAVAIDDQGRILVRG